MDVDRVMQPSEKKKDDSDTDNPVTEVSTADASTANADDEKDYGGRRQSSETQEVADFAHNISSNPDSVKMDVDRHRTEHPFLNLNLNDLLILEKKIKKLLEPSDGTPPWLDKQRVPWSVLSAVLQAMFNLTTDRELGAALRMLVDELRLRSDLTDSSENIRLQENIKQLFNNFRNIISIEGSIEMNRHRERDTEAQNALINTRKEILKVLNNICNFDENMFTTMFSQEEMREISQVLFPPDASEMLTINEYEISAELQRCASKLHHYMMYHSNMNKGPTRHFMKVFLTKIAIIQGRFKKSNVNHAAKYFEQEEHQRIDKAIREVIFRGLNVIDASMQLQRESDMPELFRATSLTKPEHPCARSRLKFRPRIAPTFAAASLAGQAGAMFGPVGAVVGAAVGAAVGGAVEFFVGASEDAAPSGFVRGKYEDEGGVVPRHPRLTAAPGVSSVGHKAIECVATPFSPPVYIKGSGGSGGDDDGGDGRGDDGGDRRGGDGGGGGGGGDGRGNVPEGGPCPESCRRFLDACHSLTDAINDLCRITSQINGMQKDCDEILRNLEFHEAMLQCGQPTSALSYAECVDELNKHREAILLLNDDQPMARIAFWRTARYISSAVCKSLDLAAQCKYFFMLRENDLESARTGIVDTRLLRKLSEKAQNTCYKMLQFQPDEAKIEAVNLMEEIKNLLAALSDAGKRSEHMNEQLDAAAASVSLAVAAVDRTLHQDYAEDSWDISIDLTQLIASIKRVCAIIEEPALVPTIGNTAEEARVRRNEVSHAARTLTASMRALITKLKGHKFTSNEVMGWMPFDLKRRNVVRAFEGLLVDVRKNGQNAGILLQVEPVPEVR